MSRLSVGFLVLCALCSHSWAYGRHLLLQLNEHARRQLPVHANLPTLEGRGSDWASCTLDLAEQILSEAGLTGLTLEQHVHWQWYPTQGTWYTIQATDRDGRSHRLDFRVALDNQAGSCRLEFDYGRIGPILAGGDHPDSVFLYAPSGRAEMQMGSVPKASSWSELQYYCQGCK